MVFSGFPCDEGEMLYCRSCTGANSLAECDEGSMDPCTGGDMVDLCLCVCVGRERGTGGGV